MIFFIYLFTELVIHQTPGSTELPDSPNPGYTKPSDPPEPRTQRKPGSTEPPYPLTPRFTKPPDPPIPGTTKTNLFLPALFWFGLECSPNNGMLPLSRNVGNGFLDLKNINSEEISKIYIILNHQYLRVPPAPGVDLDFRGHPNTVAQ